MKPITICFPYYINAGILKEQMARFRQLPDDLKSYLRLIVVDDGSPKDPAWHEEVGFPYELYRIDVDVRWNQDAARNLAVKHAQTDWLLLTDIDHIPTQQTLLALVSGEHHPKMVYRFSRVTLTNERSKSGERIVTPYKPHPNSWFMTKQMYWQIGGYDERFAGLYGTDADFRDRVQANVDQAVMLNEILIRVPRDVIPDASTTTYERKAEQDKKLGALIRKRNLTPGWQPQHFRFPWVRVA